MTALKSLTSQGRLPRGIGKPEVVPRNFTPSVRPDRGRFCVCQKKKAKETIPETEGVRAPAAVFLPSFFTA